MTPDNILCILAIIFAVIAIVFAVKAVFGYELTKEDIQEERILAICIETDIQLDYCWDMYGGIDKPYGEPKPLK